MAVVAALVAPALALGSVAKPAAASTGGTCTLIDPTAGVIDPYNFGWVPQGTFDAPQPQLSEGDYCAVIDTENTAYQLYAASHDFAIGDPEIAAIGHTALIGFFWAQLQAVIFDEGNGAAGDLTTDQQNLYNWFQGEVQTYNEIAAEDAKNEYTKWAKSPCSYNAPDPSVFSFSGSVDPACSGSLEGLLAGPTPPTYDNFLAYGSYDAQQELGYSLPNVSPAQLFVDQQAISESSVWGAALLVGSGLRVAQAAFPGVGGQIWGEIAPFWRTLLKAKWDKFTKDATKAQLSETEQVDDVMEQATDAADGVPESPAVESGADVAENAVMDAGETAQAMADTGVEAADFAGPITVIVTAVAVLVQESINIADQTKIPGQLQSNLTASFDAPNLWDMYTSTGGSTLLNTFFMATLAPLPASAAGLSAPPYHGDTLEVTDNTTGSTQLDTTTTIQTWPLGINGPEYSGTPWVQIADDRGTIWQTPDPDELAAGYTGWIQAGEIHYFDWNGDPRLAIVDGNQFIDVSAPGSIDEGGADVGDLCADAGACNVTNLIQAKDAGGNDVTIALHPDTGVNADAQVENQYGNGAGTSVSGPNDGLVAGQTVTMTDPLTSFTAYDSNENPVPDTTTYTWQIETRCAYSPANPVHTVEGVPVCYGSPDYNATSLAANEQDLSIDGSEDPAFHGDPVDTMTGQSVNVTWPAPGVYHVRLITTDAYGVTHQSDQDLTVVGTTPTVPITPSEGWSGALVFAAVPNGTSESFTGCIESPTVAYGDPSVSIGWGDGSPTDTATAEGGGSSNISFQYGATATCPSPWSFTATHTYDLSPALWASDLGFVPQEHLSLDVTDGSGDSLHDDLYANVAAGPGEESKPAFTSAATTTFTGSATFTVSTSGAPTATVTESGTLPKGIAFQPLSGGQAELTGTPYAGTGGSYPITFTAHNTNGTVTQDFTLVVDEAPSFSSSAGSLDVGSAGSIPLAPAGYPAPVVTISGNLPPGVTATGGTSPVLSGTPDPGTAGSYPLTLTAANAAGTVSETYTLTVATGPQITSAAVAGFTTGSFSSFAVTATGSPTPSLTVSGTVPPWLTFVDYGNGTGALSGTPTSDGSWSFQIDATNVDGEVSQPFTLNASSSGGPPITSASSTDFEVGTYGSFSVTSSDSNAQLSCIQCRGNLPAGLSFADNGNGTATISGTPQSGSAGMYDPLIEASDGGVTTQFLAISVEGTPVFTSSTTATFVVGQTGSFTVTTDAYPLATDLTIGQGSLPDGLTFTNNSDGTATISGVPLSDAVGTTQVQLNAVNLLTPINSPVTQELSVVVEQAPSITSAATTTFAEGTDSSFTVTTSGYPNASLTESGNLPAGLSFADLGNGTATISGTPTDTTPETASITVTAQSAAGVRSQVLLLYLGPMATFDSPADVTFQVGTSQSFTVATGGPGPVTLSTPGTLPAGLTFTDNGDGTATISGTPEAGSGGEVDLVVDAANAYGTAQQDLDLVVDEAPAYTGSPSLVLDAGVGDTQTWTLTSTGYPAATFAFSGVLPNGMTFVSNGDGTATISGVPDPTDLGDFPLSLTLTNGAGTDTVPLVLSNDESPGQPAQFSDTFTPLQSNSVTVSVPGRPVPSLSYVPGFGEGSLPGWLSATDNGNGTMTFSGIPPADAAGTSIDGQIIAENFLYTGADPFEIDVSDIVVTAASPTTATVGTAYSYQLQSTVAADLPGPGGTTYSLPAGSRAPGGLHLSAAGVLSGLPTSVGTFTFPVVISNASQLGDSVTVPVTVTVAPAPAELQVSQFRPVGPNGPGDWYVDVTNTTTADIPLTGWQVGLTTQGFTSPVLVPVGTGMLAPGASTLVVGPWSSLPSSLLANAVVVSGYPSTPAGVEVVAPDGTVTDRAGEVGAGSAVISGTGMALPTYDSSNLGDAFVRVSSTGDNAADFSFEAATPGTYVSGGAVTLSRLNWLVGGSTDYASGGGWADSSVTLFECATGFYAAGQCDAANTVSPSMTMKSTAQGAVYSFSHAAFTLATGIIDSDGDTCGLASSAPCYVVAVGASGDEGVSLPLGFSTTAVSVSHGHAVAIGSREPVSVTSFPIGDDVVTAECDSAAGPTYSAARCDASTAATGVSAGPGGVKWSPSGGVLILAGSKYSDASGGTVQKGGSAVVAVLDLTHPEFDVMVPVTINP